LVDVTRDAKPPVRVTLDALQRDIIRLVEVESPSEDLAAVARSADAVAVLGARLLGCMPERIVRDGRTHLLWNFGRPRVLVLGHHDTVWPLGTLERLPAAVHAGVLRGPGCFDMKAGVVVGMHAIAGLSDPGGVCLLVTGDEEPGSPTSRVLIEDMARTVRAALVLEASGPDGALKLERKGVSRYQVMVRGRAAHAGLDPERGVNASVEVAHQILALEALADPVAGTTVTPTRLEAGTTVNTVPAEAGIAVDVRVSWVEEQQRVDRAVRALMPVLAGARLEITGGPNRPPLTTSASKALFQRASRIAAEHGLGPLTGVSVGGASDGNFTAGVGTPTLDGLGAVGGGAHADDEHVVLAELVPRVRLLTALLADLLAETPR
jgi:glutamate carboxypeptidase